MFFIFHFTKILSFQFCNEIGKFLFYFLLYLQIIFKGDPFDYRDRVRSCIVSVYDSDISHESMSRTDLAKRSLEKPNSAKVTGFFANFADPAELQGIYLSYFLILTLFTRF